MLLQTYALPAASVGVVTALVGVGVLAGALVSSRLVARFGGGLTVVLALSTRLLLAAGPALEAGDAGSTGVAS